jgi:hypothetical protein
MRRLGSKRWEDFEECAIEKARAHLVHVSA